MGYTWLRSETHTSFFKTSEEEIVWDTYIENIIDMDVDKIGCELVNWVQLSLKRDRLL
jgi:hypothetical protein